MFTLVIRNRNNYSIYLYIETNKEYKLQERILTMKVTTYIINEGQSTQYFGLKNADENTVIYFAPNNWRTEKGALNWARKHGFEIA